VYSQNGEFLLKLRDGMFDKALTERLADNRLPNVVRLDRELGDLGLEAESVDVVMTALNYHDIANSRGPEAAARFLATAHGLLKPGGVLGLIDHNGRAGQDNKEVHRIPVADVIQAAEAAGFEVEAQGDMLRNPADDLTQNVFSPAIRGQTDRFVLRLRKAS
jgi:predicted methyltransferase